VGTYPITVNGAVSSNYTFVYTGATFTIVPTALVITANNLTKIYGAANPTFTFTYSGFVNGDTQTSLTTQPTASTTAVTTSLPGTYPITVSGAASANYTITYVPGTLTVGVIPRTLTFNPITPQTYGNADFDPGATVSSGDAVVYTTSDNTIATVINNKIHIVTAGTVTVYASVASRVNYADVATGSQQLIINRASQVIVFYPIPLQQKGGAPFNLNLTASSGLPVTLTSSDPTTASIDPLTQAISPLGIGSVTITATQAGNINYLPITATEVLRIQDSQDLVFVRPGFSPNNDGINDVMIIEGIKDYPDNDITIVDRNGAKYYHASNYDNTSVVFDGHSNITGNMLRPGTYFYELNYKVNGQSKRKAGYIIIKY
jgi:gliding motility-associated-like protein